MRSSINKVFLISISLMMKYLAIDWNNSFLKEKIILFIVYKTLFVNPFEVNVPILYSQKTSGKQRFLNRTK